MKRQATTRCPYCHKPVGSLGILNDHIYAKHPEQGAVLRKMQKLADDYKRREG